MKGLSAFRIPFGTIYINETMGSLDINQVYGMGRHDCQIDFKHLFALTEFKIMKQHPSIRQTITQKTYGLAFCIVGWGSADLRNHLGHYLPPVFIASSTRVRAWSSKHTACSRAS